MSDELIQRSARTLEAITPLLLQLEDLGQVREQLKQGQARGYYTPDEDEQIHQRFSTYLTARAVLLSTIEDLKPLALRKVKSQKETLLRAFLVAYTAACLLVRAGRAIVNELAPEEVTRKKLDEAMPALGIPRKQFTVMYQSLTSPRNAWRLYSAQRFAEANKEELRALGQELELFETSRLLDQSEQALQVSVGRYLRGHLRFQLYELLRWNRSSLEKALFAVFEGSGRLISRLHWPWYRKRVNATVQRKLLEILQPGDVLVTRHNDAMTNLFLPGFWPHAALHIGSADEGREWSVEPKEDQRSRWAGEMRMLEALKDGVHFRTLESTLSVDAVAVIRPQLPPEQVGAALTRALKHEGKLYDFAFDFTRSDRVVCTEVVYRAYHGVGDLHFDLKERAGRMTLAAEDLLDMAVDGKGFHPVAVFGTPQSRRRVVTGEAARSVLAASYR